MLYYQGWDALYASNSCLSSCMALWCNGNTAVSETVFLRSSRSKAELTSNILWHTTRCSKPRRRLIKIKLTNLLAQCYGVIASQTHVTPTACNFSKCTYPKRKVWSAIA